MSPPRGRTSAPVYHAGIELRDVFDDEEMGHWWDGSRWPAEQVPRFLQPFCVWDPGEAWILRRVTELGLIPASRSNPLLTNNALIPVFGMAEVARFGFSSFEVEFAKNVREGRCERRYWLHIFEMLEHSTRTGRYVNQTVQQVLSALDLTKHDIRIPA